MVRRLIVNSDGGSRGNPGPAGYGAVVTDADSGTLLAERSEYIGTASNNVAEYRGLIAGLEAARLIDAEAQVEVRADSKLVIEQMSGRWKIKHPDMKELALEAAKILPRTQVTYTWVPRAENAAADALANKAMDERATTNTDAWRELATCEPRPAFNEEQTNYAEPPQDAEQTGSTARPLHVPVGRPAGSPATVVLVRHGVTTQTLNAILAGGDTPGPDLTETGREQAGRAARLLSRLSEIWSGVPEPSMLLASPLVRTQQTAQIIGEALGLTPTTDARLAEALFGEWQELPAAEVQNTERFQAYTGTGRVSAPGGESLLDVGRRMGALFSELTETRAGQTVVAASHSVTIRSGLGLALGADPGRWWMLRIPPASLSVLRLWPAENPEDGPRVEVVAVGVPGEVLTD